jgi:hypothetical protein
VFKRVSISRYAEGPIPFTKEPWEHPFAQLIDEHLLSIGISPDEVKNTEPGILSYAFATNNKICNHFTIYKTPADQELFVFLQVCLGIIPKDSETKLAYQLLTEIGNNPSPMRFAIDEIKDQNISVVVLQFRCFAAGITSEHLALRLKTILDYGSETSQRLIQDYGLLSLPIDWFHKTPSLH